MFHFTLNRAAVTVDADRSLLDYLREDARLTSVKDGCAEGVCGSCSVLVEGKAVRACKLTTAQVHGKAVTTAEGLSARDREMIEPAALGRCHIDEFAFNVTLISVCGLM